MNSKNLDVIMTNTEIFHIFHIISLFNLPFFHIFQIFSLFDLLFFLIFYTTTSNISENNKLLCNY